MKKHLLFFVFFLLMITPFFFVFAQGWDPANYSSSGLPGGRIYDIIRNIMLWGLSIFGFIGIIGFAVSGIMYLTAAGNETQIENAKKAMKWSLVGVIVGISGLVILWAVDTALAPISTGGMI